MQNTLEEYFKLNKLQQELGKIEKKVDNEESKKSNVEEELAKPSIYSNPSSLKEQTDKLNLINSTVADLHGKWEELAMEIDQMENQ